MAVAVSVTPAEQTSDLAFTVSVTGGVATTAYNLTATYPSGSVQTIPFTTDGSGNATLSVPCFDVGTYTFAVGLAAPTLTTTTAVGVS